MFVWLAGVLIKHVTKFEVTCPNLAPRTNLPVPALIIINIWYVYNKAIGD